MHDISMLCCRSLKHLPACVTLVIISAASEGAFLSGEAIKQDKLRSFIQSQSGTEGEAQLCSWLAVGNSASSAHADSSSGNGFQ